MSEGSNKRTSFPAIERLAEKNALFAERVDDLSYSSDLLAQNVGGAVGASTIRTYRRNRIVEDVKTEGSLDRGVLNASKGYLDLLLESESPDTRPRLEQILAGDEFTAEDVSRTLVRAGHHISARSIRRYRQARK